MITLEVFVSTDCVSTDSAIRLAEEVSRQVEGVELEVYRIGEFSERASELKIFMTPTFVVEGEIFSVGEPKKEWLLTTLRRLSRWKKTT